MKKNSHKLEIHIMVENFINDELRMRGYNVDVGDVEIHKQILLSSFLQKVLDDGIPYYNNAISHNLTFNGH